MMKFLSVAESVLMSVRKCCVSTSDCCSFMSLAPMWTMIVEMCGRLVVSPGMRVLMSITFSPENECVSPLGILTCLTMEEPTTKTEGADGWVGMRFGVMGSVCDLKCSDLVSVSLKKG